MIGNSKVQDVTHRDANHSKGFLLTKVLFLAPGSSEDAWAWGSTLLEIIMEGKPCFVEKIVIQGTMFHFHYYVQGV